jgi:hypothetical protein
MNISLRKHVIDLIPMLTLGGIFKVLIIPNWDNMTYTNPIVIHPIMTAWLLVGWALVFFVINVWRRLLNNYDKKHQCVCTCHQIGGAICGDCINSKTCKVRSRK